jgi:hypothetical protein
MTTTLEIDVEVEFLYHKAVQPYLSGPPENCYPGEDASAEILSVKFNGLEISDNLSVRQIEEIEAECIEDASRGSEE